LQHKHRAFTEKTRDKDDRMLETWKQRHKAEKKQGIRTNIQKKLLVLSYEPLKKKGTTL
jgi:hypothetical protein